jgi:hypothetical protein
MVPNSIKVPVSSELVFPHGAMLHSVEPLIDFDAKKAGAPDPQARDKDTGRRLWTVRVIDLDPEAGKFGSSTEVKVKVAAEYQPVPPAPQVPGFPPKVEFVGVTLTPYVNTKNNRLGWSVRAEDFVAFGAAPEAVS